MTETDIMNEIRLALNPFGITFRGNVGKIRMQDGRIFDTGLPKGFSDLFGFRRSDGRVYFIEVKTENGRIRPEQIHFIESMKKNGALAGIARSPEEAIEIVKGASR